MNIFPNPEPKGLQNAVILTKQSWIQLYVNKNLEHNCFTFVSQLKINRLSRITMLIILISEYYLLLFELCLYTM